MSSKVLVVLIGLAFVTGIVQGQDNATITQPGTGNEALIVQVAEDLTLMASIDQAGNENDGQIIQLGGYGNAAEMAQSANYGQAMILQEGGADNQASVTQNAPGSGNEMFVWQLGGQGNNATAVQSGNGNTGSILQSYSFNSVASLTQNGNNNGQDCDSCALPTQAADLAQAQYLAGVCFGAWSIFQCGFDLTAVTEVNGNCNNTFQFQEGEGHVAMISIEGNENTAFQAQCGCDPTISVIDIAGNGNCAGQLMWGGTSSSIAVTGNCNSALVISGVCCN